MNSRFNIATCTFGMIVLLVATSNPAQAKFYAHAYVRPIVQYTTLVNQASSRSEIVSIDPRFGGGVGAGAVFGKRERFELGAEITSIRFDGKYWVGYNATTRTTSYDKVDYQVTPFLVTFRYYFRDKDAAIRPYLGGFWGIYDLETSRSYESKSGIGFTAGIGGGVSFNLGGKVSLDVGYRYIESTEAIEGSSYLWVTGSDFSYTAHVLSMGLNVRF